MTSLDVRESLLRALVLDLVGPDPGSELANEVLLQAPSRWYLTGFLVPLDAPPEDRADETNQETLDVLADAGGTDDAAPPEPVAARRAYFPSSIGLSVLVPPGVETFEVTVHWGDYRREGPGGEDEDADDPDSGSDSGSENIGTGGSGPGNGPAPRGRRTWRRVPRMATLQVTLPQTGAATTEDEVPESGGLRLVVSSRPVDAAVTARMVPPGTQAVSVFLVNRRPPGGIPVTRSSHSKPS